ncbi:hypothetical protein [Ruegeria aquimaris]|uniref:Uncharacterized protein n=1 Tax=Ruegeria aquimaris TaxID=2984333 RepID=A0ABT3AM35_9RHOB|nr:hypothetical protein [Ruegeria sp. XHP0148]MCV2889357.1 hypothetical protein [Ruegeria sp. XHP0148]
MSRQRSPLLAILGFPVRVVRSLPRTLLALLVIGGLVFNILTLTVSGAFTAASGILSAAGLSTVAARESAEAALRREAADKANREALERATREASEKAAREARETALREAAERRLAVNRVAASTRDAIGDRLARQAARNSASVFAEAIPVVGVGVIAAALVLEVKDSCDTARDMTALVAAIETEGDAQAAREAAAAAFDCADLIPNYDDLPTKDQIWGEVSSAPEKAWDKATGYYDTLAGADWSAVVGNVGTYAVSWGENAASVLNNWVEYWFNSASEVQE